MHLLRLGAGQLMVARDASKDLSPRFVSALPEAVRKGLVPSAAEKIVEAIIQRIEAHRLPPGAKLGETQLAQILDVEPDHRAAGPAAAVVHRRRTVHIEPRRLHSRVHTKQAADLYAARRVIETETVLLLARHCTANDIRTLRQHVEWEREMEASGNSLDLVRLRSDFHLVLARLAGNQVLADMLERLLPQTALIRSFYGSPEFSSRPTDDHDRLITLLAKGDEQGCLDVIREHLHLDERKLVIPANQGGANFKIAKAFGPEDGSQAGARNPPRAIRGKAGATISTSADGPPSNRSANR